MDNTTTIYLLSEDPKLKKWADLFAKNLELICVQFLNTKASFTLQSFNGKLSDATNHVFLLDDLNVDYSTLKLADANSSICQIHLNRISYKNLPSFLQNVSVFEFYESDPISLETNWSDLTSGSGNLWEKLLDFTKSIFGLYAQDRETIYLSITSVNQIANRDKLKRDLLNQGFQILPNNPLDNSNIGELEKKIETLIKDASLSVHIYGNDKTIDSNLEAELVDLQNKICAKNNSKNFNRLIWLPSDVRLDKANNEKISLLRKDLELLKGAEFVEAPLELFKSLIYQKIESSSAKNKLDQKGLYFIYDNTKDKEVNRIKSELEKTNLNVLEVDNFGNNPLINHKKNLNNSKGIIIYFDGHNDKWIESILNDIIKAPKYRNNKKINSIGVISNSDLKLKPELASYQLDQIKLDNQTQLDSFIQKIDK